MDALISGTNGRALLLDAGTLKSFDVDEPSELVPRKPADFANLFGEMQDLRVIENTDIEFIRQELRFDCDSALALDLVLLSLDAELPDDIRKEAIEGVGELLADDRVVEHLENILYARPLPDEGDLIGALRLSERESSLSRFLQRLEGRQEFISEVSLAWDSIPVRVFGGPDHESEFLDTAASEGLFRTLAIVRETGSPTLNFLLSVEKNDSVSRLHNHRQVLQHWLQCFPQASRSTVIKNEIEEEVVFEALPRRRHGRRIGIDRPAMLREVNRRKSVIVEALRRRDLGLLTRLVAELIDYQRNAEPVHVAKSLCDLAMEAKSLGMFTLQLELTDRSVNVAPDDGWSWAQHGDALLNVNRLDQALAAFQQAKDFGAGVIAGKGRAEVLKAQGQLSAALAAFDEIIKEHPEDVVAKNGRAEVLKAQGLLPAALAAFDEVIKEHPEDVVAKTGRAEVLKAQGQLAAALAAFDEVIKEHPRDVVAKTGRAEVLKAQGQLPAALAAFDEVIKEHPENVVAKTGRSCVLALMSRYDEALSDLPDSRPARLEDWVGYHVRGMILLHLGRFSESIQILSEGVQNNPIPSSREYFRRALAVDWLRSRDYKKAAEALEEVKSPLLQPIANVLRIHAFGAQGKLRQAEAAYDSLAEDAQLSEDELTQELRNQFILNQPAHRDNQWISEREVHIVLRAA